MDQLTDFNLRILNVPEEWKQPLVETIDTMSAISVGIKSELNVNNPAIDCPELLLALTKIALERHDNAVANREGFYS